MPLCLESAADSSLINIGELYRRTCKALRFLPVLCAFYA